MTRARRLALVAVVLAAAALNTGAVRRFLNDVEILGTLDVTGDSTLGGALTSSGAVTLEGPISASPTFTIDPGALDVYGATRLRGLASADRTFSVPDLSASGNLEVDGAVTVAGEVSIDSSAVIAPVFAQSRPSLPPILIRFYEKNLSSGAVTWDVSGDLIGDVVGAVATRKAASGGGAEVAANWTGSSVTIDDGSGSSSDAVSVIVWGTPPE